jgi:hypothetical protein
LGHKGVWEELDHGSLETVNQYQQHVWLLRLTGQMAKEIMAALFDGSELLYNRGCNLRDGALVEQGRERPIQVFNSDSRV